MNTVDIDCSPYIGYDQMESFGEPWDAWLAGMEMDGHGCTSCGVAVAAILFDGEDGQLAMRWVYTQLVEVSGAVMALCEKCAADA